MCDIAHDGDGATEASFTSDEQGLIYVVLQMAVWARAFAQKAGHYARPLPPPIYCPSTGHDTLQRARAGPLRRHPVREPANCATQVMDEVRCVELQTAVQHQYGGGRCSRVRRGCAYLRVCRATGEG